MLPLSVIVQQLTKYTACSRLQTQRHSPTNHSPHNMKLFHGRPSNIPLVLWTRRNVKETTELSFNSFRAGCRARRRTTS